MGSLYDRQLSTVLVCHLSLTLSNEICEVTGPLKPKFHLWHPWAGELKFVFYENWLFSLVAMAT